MFIIPEVVAGQQTNLAKVSVACGSHRSSCRAGHATLYEMCCVTKEGSLWAPNVFTLQMNLPYKFFNLRFFRDDQVEDEDDASEEEGTCSVQQALSYS